MKLHFKEVQSICRIAESLCGLRKKNFCWKEEKDLLVRSPLDHSIQPANAEPVLCLPGLQPIICLISSDLVKETVQGAAAVYYNTHTTE